MAANQLDLIMSQVQRLAASEQLQIIKRVADLLARAEQSLPEIRLLDQKRRGCRKSSLKAC